jgi:hypothetical protein
MSRFIPMAQVRLKKRASIHWQKPGRFNHEDSLHRCR